jgi:hypothetical protein
MDFCHAYHNCWPCITETGRLYRPLRMILQATVLILTPVKEASECLQSYFAGLRNPDYPPGLISLSRSDVVTSERKASYQITPASGGR